MYSLHSKSITKHLLRYVLGSPIAMVACAVWLGIMYAMLHLTSVELPIYDFTRALVVLGVLNMLVTQLEMMWLPAAGLHVLPKDVAGHPNSGLKAEEIYRRAEKKRIKLDTPKAFRSRPRRPLREGSASAQELL